MKIYFYVTFLLNLPFRYDETAFFHVRSLSKILFSAGFNVLWCLKEVYSETSTVITLGFCQTQSGFKKVNGKKLFLPSSTDEKFWLKSFRIYVTAFFVKLQRVCSNTSPSRFQKIPDYENDTKFTRISINLKLKLFCLSHFPLNFNFWYVWCVLDVEYCSFYEQLFVFSPVNAFSLEGFKCSWIAIT